MPENDRTNELLDNLRYYAYAYIEKLDRPAQVIVLVRVLGEQGGIAGVNIEPTEVEHVLAAATEEVRQAALADVEVERPNG